MKTFECQICGKIFKSISHLRLHNIADKDYYDRYIRQPNEGFCEYCHKEAKFVSLQYGYRNTCGYSCAGKLRELNRTDEQILASNEKRKQTYLKNYGTEYPMQSDIVKQKLINTNMLKYGTPSVWSSGCVVRDKIEQTMIERYGGVGYGSKFTAELLEFMKNGNYCYPMYNGNTEGYYDIHDRFEDTDTYNRISN